MVVIDFDIGNILLTLNTIGMLYVAKYFYDLNQTKKQAERVITHSCLFIGSLIYMDHILTNNNTWFKKDIKDLIINLNRP